MAQRPSSQIEVPSSNGGTGTSPSDSQSNDRPRRQFQAWHGAGIVLLLAVGGLLLYGFWPVLMGTVEEDERPEVEEAAVSGAQIEVVEVTPVDFPLRAEATGALAPWRQSAVSAEAGGEWRTDRGAPGGGRAVCAVVPKQPQKARVTLTVLFLREKRMINSIV